MIDAIFFIWLIKILFINIWNTNYSIEILVLQRLKQNKSILQKISSRKFQREVWFVTPDLKSWEHFFLRCATTWESKFLNLYFLIPGWSKSTDFQTPIRPPGTCLRNVTDMFWIMIFRIFSSGIFKLTF